MNEESSDLTASDDGFFRQRFVQPDPPRLFFDNKIIECKGKDVFDMIFDYQNSNVAKVIEDSKKLTNIFKRDRKTEVHDDKEGGDYFTPAEKLVFAKATWDDIADTQVGRLVTAKIDDLKREKQILTSQVRIMYQKQEQRIKDVTEALERDMNRRVD